MNTFVAEDLVSHPWLRIDTVKTVSKICENLRNSIAGVLSKRGAVIAVSGGIDSSVCAALAVRALGKGRVFGLLLPEEDSPSSSTELGEKVCRHLGISFKVHDISKTLEAIGCYENRDEAIHNLFPEYSRGWKNKIVISNGNMTPEHYNFFKLIVQFPGGELREKRLPLKEYLQIVAATNYKQRIRKTIEYFHADRLNYAVIGTPNRLEYDQGFFVKNGDGSADVKPIAHLYKSQVYALGKYLGLPKHVCSSVPATDTWSLQQGQDEFYFVLPYKKMDIALYGFNHGMSPEVVAREIALTPEQVLYVFKDIQIKRKTTRPLHMKPILVDEISEVSPS